MFVLTIKDQIVNWTKESKEPGDYWEKIVGYLKTFEELTGLDKYINDDSENYWDANCYKELLEGINVLTSPAIVFSEIKSSDQDGQWTFSFKLNDQDSSLKMENPKTDWIQEQFIEQLNQLFIDLGVEKRLKMVWATSQYNTDQCFDLCFIDDATYQKLLNHSPKYAYGE